MLEIHRLSLHPRMLGPSLAKTIMSLLSYVMPVLVMSISMYGCGSRNVCSVSEYVCESSLAGIYRSDLDGTHRQPNPAARYVER